ncbi:hypothetical protein BGX26_004434 [Mortierella sp. AD094]|nr:hypothetical protein BGX26_004434 [Mortierella sp. AD094]
MIEVPSNSSDHHLVDIPDDSGTKLDNGSPVTRSRYDTFGFDSDGLAVVGDPDNISQRKITLPQAALSRIDTDETVSSGATDSPGDGVSKKTSIIISKGDLKTSCMSNVEDAGHGVIFRWKLHRQVVVQQNCQVRLTMRIRAIETTQRVTYPRYLDLYFMEFHASMNQGYTNDQSLRANQPVVCSIDVNQKSYHKEVIDPNQQKIILHYAISGNERYAVTLSATKKDFVIDIWDLKHSKDAIHIDGSWRTSPAQNEIKVQLPPSHPKRSAGVSILLPVDYTLNSPSASPFKISISFQGSMIVLLDRRDVRLSVTRRKDTPSASRRYITNIQQSKESQTLNDLKLCKGLENFYGYGKFHSTVTESIGEKEFFFAYNRKYFSIYNVSSEWQHIRSIEFEQPQELPSLYDWDRGFPGPYFVWADHISSIVSAINIQSGSIVLYLPPRTEHTNAIGGANYSFSSDYSMIAIVRSNSITIYCASSGTIITSRTWEYNGERLCDPSLSAVTLCTFFGSKLDLFRLEDCEINLDIREKEPWPIDPAPRYDDTCGDRPSPLSNVQKDYLSSSQLHFQVASQPGPVTNILGRVDQEQPSVVLSIYNAQRCLLQTLVIPPYKDSQGHIPTSTRYTDPFLLDDPPRLVVVSRRLIMIWKLPENAGEGPSLDLAWGFPDERKREWKQCIHHQLHFHLGDNCETNENSPQCVNPVFSRETAESVLDGVMELIHIHQESDAAMRNAILQYFNSILNNHPDSRNCVLNRICNGWSIANSNSIERFLEALFESEHGRWIPSADMDQDKNLNPLKILLEKAETEPLAMGPAEIIINYCFWREEKERNRHFLMPVIQCLNVLFSQERPHSDLALRVLRRFAFIPVDKAEHAFIMDYHLIAHPPFLRLRFWKNYSKLLYNCEDPILQLNSHSCGSDPTSKYFTIELFVAPINILWQYKNSASTGITTDRPPSKLSPWISIPLCIIWHKFKTKSDSIVRCHQFTLEELDNPAIFALVEYKWNTIGFKYYVLRMFCNFIYGLLLVTVVFLQVYGTHRDVVAGVFIAIICCACIWLWLELIWLIRNRNRHVQLLRLLKQVPLISSLLFGVTLQQEATQGFSASLGYSFACIVYLKPAQSTETGFPLNPLKAFITTLFFAGGRYDPVTDLFDSDNYAFLIMITFYFVSVGILVINILIAWVNAAYDRGDAIWRQVWLEQRMKYIEAAENISYHIPGLRETSGWFPEEIYYTATRKEINKYRKDTESLLNAASPSMVLDVTNGMTKGAPKMEINLSKDVKSVTMVADTGIESTVNELNVRLEEKSNMLLKEIQQNREQGYLVSSLKEQVQSLGTRVEGLLQEQNVKMEELLKLIKNM